MGDRAAANSGRTLAGVKLLDGLVEADRMALEGQCAWRRYAIGERIFERDSVGREVFFVIEGAISVVSFSATGREVQFATAGPGELVGELAAIDGRARSASVVATEDAMLAVLPADAFVTLLKANGEVTFELLRRLSEMVRASGRQVLELSSMAATGRIHREILRRAAPDPNSPELWVVRPLPPLRELASAAGTTREHVTAALNQLYPSGLVKRRGDSLYILDREALEAIIAAAAKPE